MTIAIGSDHRGNALKEILLSHLRENNIDVVDLSGLYNEHDDYPDSAGAVGAWVSKSPSDRRGVVLCGSGVGASIVANKYQGVRAGLCFSIEQTRAARHDDDINILAIASDYVSESDAVAMMDVFLNTLFADEERFIRRIEKITAIENEQ